MRLILLLFILYSACDASKESEKTEAVRHGYAFYHPLTLSSDHPAKVCLAIEKDLLPANVRVSFTNQTCEEVSCKPHTAVADFSCWEIPGPKYHGTHYGTFTITAEIETNDKKVTFKGESEVGIFENEQKVIMETDRRVYKMGDTVKLRLLALDFDMKPIKNYQVPSLVLRSPYPSSAKVKQWENITMNMGLAHFEFQLAHDAPEGYWSISGDGVYGGFDVKKYILPRFQSILTGPGHVYNGSEGTTYTLCGKYSYGRHVKGVALLGGKINHGYMKQPTSFSQVKDLSGGCAKFELYPEDLHLDQEHVWSIELTASVTEEGTEQVESTSKFVYISNNPFSAVWNQKNRYIKHKLPYKGELEFKDVKVQIETVQLCYSRQAETEKICNNHILGSDNKLIFTIPPLKNLSEVESVQVEASVPGVTINYNPVLYLNVWQSNSSSSIMILNTEPNSVDCQSSLLYDVVYNSDRFNAGEEIEFKYMLTSRGDIITAGSVLNKSKKKVLNLDDYANVIGKENYKEANSIDQFELKIKLDKKVYTSAKLLVYYDYDGEVVSDAIDIQVKDCSPNQVAAMWKEETLYPGEVGNLNIKTDKESLCSVSSVDKASSFLGSGEVIDAKTVLNSFRRYFNNYELNCIKPEVKTDKNGTIPLLPIYHRYYGPGTDSYAAFKDSNIGVISNLRFISRKCKEHMFFHHPQLRLRGGPNHLHLGLRGGPTLARPGIASGVAVQAFSASAEGAVLKGGGASVDNRGSEVRSFFPETWLWDLVPVEEGEATLDRKLPDSITDWDGNVVCMSSNSGFGISDKIEIRGFKPFFVDILLPYSIKRNKEILHLPIPVFNYLNHSLPIRVTLEPSEHIVLVDGEDKNSFTMCLGAEDSYTHQYRIKATKIGYVNITVTANVDPAYAKDCAPDSVIRRRDVVLKSLLVEPEGYPSNLIKSALLCANDTLAADNLQWSIELPENVVEDTVDGRVTINSDILGPMFQNLENILVVPTGCGEQTMATLTPNLYVLKYLEANNALTDEVKKKIFKNLEIGYQRMLNYVHSDGSFSAFGPHEPDGSMFLTSFVIRTFRQMKKYVFIDDDVINKAIKWVISHQLENGCFDPVHHVFHEMGLASSKNQTTALTSYVLISFLETNTKISEDILSKAKKCILEDKTFDKYTMAISSYALGLMNSPQEAKERLDKLNEVADSKNDMTWWTQAEHSNSANVEVSGYVLMSLLKQDPVTNLGIGSSIVRWLQTQMNPRGGFFSTTDTVVGLDAISRYALLVNKKEPNVKISLQTKTDKKNLEITKRDRTKPEILPLTVYPNEIKAKIEGDGCVAIQTSVSYYLDKPLAIDDLQLDVELKPVNQKLKCSIIEIKPCVAYAAPGKINMAIVEVNMLSGYAPDQASLYELTSNPYSAVKKFEQIGNQVVFYMTQLGKEKVCLPFKIEENLIVENIANATVKLYDYYKPELSVSKSFTIEDCHANTNVPA